MSNRRHGVGLVGVALWCCVACGEDEGAVDGAVDGGTDGGAEALPPSGCPARPSEDTTAPVSGPVPSFTQTTLVEPNGAAFLTPYDVDGDHFPELLLTTLVESLDLSRLPMGAPLSAGGAYVLAREGGGPTGELGTWSLTTGFDKEAEVDWPNGSTVFDVDNDGIDDWVVGAGFIVWPTGELVWMKGDGEGGFGEVQEISDPNESCFYHEALPLDIDDDGDTDFVTTCHDLEAGESKLEWFENDGVAGQASFTHHAIGEGGGALMELHDLDEDGDEDILVPQFFGGKSLVWVEQKNAGAEWTVHEIDDTTGLGFRATMADVDGDGKLDVVYDNHNHQDAEAADEQVMGVYWWKVPEDPTGEWGAKNVIHEGFNIPEGEPGQAGAPGSFDVGDVDGDGDLDVAVSGDGDPGLYLFVQQEDGFEMIELDTGHVNSGSPVIMDLDGDCDMDIAWAVFGPRPSGSQIEFTSAVYAFLQD